MPISKTRQKLTLLSSNTINGNIAIGSSFDGKHNYHVTFSTVHKIRLNSCSVTNSKKGFAVNYV